MALFKCCCINVNCIDCEATSFTAWASLEGWGVPEHIDCRIFSAINLKMRRVVDDLLVFEQDFHINRPGLQPTVIDNNTISFPPLPAYYDTTGAEDPFVISGTGELNIQWPGWPAEGNTNNRHYLTASFTSEISEADAIGYRNVLVAMNDWTNILPTSPNRVAYFDQNGASIFTNSPSDMILNVRLTSDVLGNPYYLRSPRASGSCTIRAPGLVNGTTRAGTLTGIYKFATSSFSPVIGGWQYVMPNVFLGAYLAAWQESKALIGPAWYEFYLADPLVRYPECPRRLTAAGEIPSCTFTIKLGARQHRIILPEAENTWKNICC